MTDRQRVEQLERELAAAVELHERYTRAVDKALGEPRDLTDGWLLEQHLAAINGLKNPPAEPQPESEVVDALRQAHDDLIRAEGPFQLAPDPSLPFIKRLRRFIAEANAARYQRNVAQGMLDELCRSAPEPSLRKVLLDRLQLKDLRHLERCYWRLPLPDREAFWDKLMEAFLWRGWAESGHRPRPETMVRCVVEIIELFAKNGMHFEEYT